MGFLSLKPRMEIFKQNNTEHQFSANLMPYWDGRGKSVVQMSVRSVSHELLNNNYFIILSLMIRLGLLVLILKIKAKSSIIKMSRLFEDFAVN